MFIYLLVIIAMITIAVSLGSALFYLVRDSKGSSVTVKALTWRIGLSLVLFAFLIAAYGLGWIEPHGLYR